MTGGSRHAAGNATGRMRRRKRCNCAARTCDAPKCGRNTLSTATRFTERTCPPMPHRFPHARPAAFRPASEASGTDAVPGSVASLSSVKHARRCVTFTWSNIRPAVSSIGVGSFESHIKGRNSEVYDRYMKTFLCILLFSVAAFGQMADAKKQNRRDKPECKPDRFPGVLLAPTADQTITGAHYLILQTGVESLKLFPGFQENHSAFAQGADYYTHADEGFRSPYINFNKSKGTQAAPTPITYTGVYEADSIGGINFGGWDGSSYGVGAAIYTNNDEDWTPTAHGAHLSIYGTFSGVLTQDQIMQFGGKDATGTGSPQGNIISMRPISFRGNTPSSPAIYYTINPPSIKMRTADDSADVPLTVGSLAVTTPHTPVTSFEPCDVGTIAWDANFVYVCVATNTWRRSALAAW